MIFEFAVDPALLPIWAQPKHFRFWRRQFGIGERRVVSAIPSKAKWKEFARKVMQDPDIQRAVDPSVLADLAAMLCGEKENWPVVNRLAPGWNTAQPWIANAMAEHRREPLTGILCGAPTASTTPLIDASDYAVDSAHWQLAADAFIDRTADAYARALEPMLRAARRVVFVDPHVDFHDTDWRAPLLKMTAAACAGHVPVQAIEFVVKHDRDQGKPSPRRTWESTTPFGKVPMAEALAATKHQATKVSCRSVRQRQGGQKLHDRFVITDLGAVQFSIGLDAGKRGESDSCNLLSLEKYLKVWADYVEPGAFDVVESW